MCVLRRERDEAQKVLSSIHRWIERNHADGFIDSLTYSQNLERVVDNWYDRIDAIEKDSKRFVRERDEARGKYDNLAAEHMLAVNKLCNERDEAIEKHRLAVIHWQIGVFKMQRERDEARAVAGEMGNIASKYLSFLLAVTPTKANETHEKETMKVIDALKRWKKL
jgi:hypothetical protein